MPCDALDEGLEPILGSFSVIDAAGHRERKW
jgi:hypothetical protein